MLTINNITCFGKIKHAFYIGLMNIKRQNSKGEIIIYKSPTGPEIQVRLEKDTVWLDAHLMVKLFEVNRPAIVKHINNINKTGEFNKKSTCSKIEQVAADGKVRKMNLYNFDMIISVGYRVNSRKATLFRIWATKTLKNHLVNGYTINEKRLHTAQKNLQELTKTIEYLKKIKTRSTCWAGAGNPIAAF